MKTVLILNALDRKALDMANNRAQSRVIGIDLTQIDGINVVTAQTILADTGTDISAWEKHYLSWLGICRIIVSAAGKFFSEQHGKVIGQ
jgi:transposase